MNHPPDPDALHGHQIRTTWMGAEILTLADLWPDPARAMIVGVNPAPASVRAGHYYQGANSRTAMTRLQSAGLLPPSTGGFLDDAALAEGVGFTDVVKRPTARAADLSSDELRHGRNLLNDQLAGRHVPLIICVFRPAVEAILGRSGSPGFQDARTGAGTLVFRMPGPYSPREDVDRVMATLAGHLDGADGSGAG